MADRLRVALEVQAHRCSGDIPGGPFDLDASPWRRTMIERALDIDLFVVALRRLVRLGRWVVEAQFSTPELRAANDRFTQAVGAVVDVRDAQEHFDDYLSGVGKRQLAGEHPSGWGYGVGSSGGTITYGDRVIIVADALNAAQDFHRALRKEVDRQAVPDDLHWASTVIPKP